MKRQKLKKVLAAALSAAMVVTGINLPTFQQIKAEETTVDTTVAVPLDAAAKADAISEPYYSSAEAVSSPKLSIPEEDWTDKKEIVYQEGISGVKNPGNFDMTFTLGIDEAGYQSLAAKEDNYLKIQGVVKLGAKWTWTQSEDIPYLTADKFTKAGDVYTTPVTIQFRDKDADDLMGIYIELVGTGFEGVATVSDLKLTEVKVAATTEQQIYSNDQSADQLVDFSTIQATDEEDWEKTIAQMDYDEKAAEKNAVAGEKIVVRAKVTAGKDLMESLEAEGSYIKVQSVVKTGDDWEWCQGDDYPYLDKAAFKENEDGTYTADIESKYSACKANLIQAVIFRFVGKVAKGTVNVSNVTIANIVSKDESLPAKDPTVVEDFEAYETGSDAGWKNETGWRYDGGDILPVVAENINGSKALKLNLDYSKNSAETWSEAKIKKDFPDGFDISAYNQITYDLIYPETLDNFKVKVYAENVEAKKAVIDKDVTPDTVETLDNGLKKASVVVKFSPTELPMTKLTIGTVGVSTKFIGDVYIDNITLSQNDPSKDFVEITSKVTETPAQADLTKMPTEVALADENASENTAALFSYLKGLSDNHQVLFGHQNDTHKSVRSEAKNGDVCDITGSISGLVGIDTLSLSGKEMGEASSDIAVEKAIEIGKKAAAEGAIITLSGHIPNMSTDKITQKADGSYEFVNCDFNETKDLSNNCSQEVLPGGKYNDRFNAYLDIIVKYAKGLGDIPVLFRPLHECDGGWFWWGSATTDPETYKALYRYVVDYLQANGVNNFLYVYSPGGPVLDTEKYLLRYPGDDYIDIMAFDYYDDYNSYPAEYSDEFFGNLEKTCTNLKTLADSRGKIAAISETGSRVMKKDGSDNEGILVKDNPFKGHNWYKQVGDIAAKTGMPYWMAWANFGDTNFYVPYKYNDTLGQEQINDFIDYYNDDASIFANGTNFYDKAAQTAVKNTTVKNAKGYLVNLFSKAVIKQPTTVLANVKNADKVQVLFENPTTGIKVLVDAQQLEPTASDVTKDTYAATLTAEDLEKLEKTDVGKVSLVADNKKLVTIDFISFNKDKDTLPKNVVDNFELYYGDNDYLNGTFSENSAAGCSSSFSIDSENKASGNYGGSFDFTLKSAGSEVWTGRMKSLPYTDYSEYNALTFWLKPDGKDKKTIIQLCANGEDFEVNVHDFIKTTDAKYVTIPFDQFVGKKSGKGKLDSKNLSKFAVWCNSTPGEETNLSSSIVFDDIQFVKADLSKLDVNADGYALTDKPVTTAVEVPAPATVTGVKSAAYTDSTIKLTWKAAKNATGYEVQRYNDKKKAYVTVAKTKSTSYTDKKLTASTGYKYRVRAYNSSKTGSFSSVVKAYTCPKKVTGLSAKATAKQVKISWKKQSGVSGYYVYRSTKKNGTYKQIAKVKGNSYTDKKVKKKTTYYYTVKAYKTVSGKTYTGAATSPKSVKTKSK
ncbi:MAG: glycosyl hydrolase [Lachnospiraceae bacterium]